MKVVLVNGSPHPEGSTHTALSIVAEARNGHGVETEMFPLGTKPLSGGIDCRKCADLGRCVFDDRGNEFTEVAKTGDGFAFGGLLLLGLLVLNEWRARRPVMPLRLFANRERAGAYAARVYIAIFLQRGTGFDPFRAGRAFLPMTLPNFLSALAVPGLTERFGNGRLLTGGLMVSLAAGVASAFSAGGAMPVLVLVRFLIVRPGKGGVPRR